MHVVCDSSPLIWLTKTGNITLLKQLYESVAIPEEVYNEVVTTGLREGYSNAHVIREQINQGWIRVEKLDEETSKRCALIAENAPEIHLGEVQVILLAQSLSLDLLMDESCGRAFAESWGLNVHGTLYLVLRGLREAIYTQDEAKDVISSMVEKGFRIEPRLLTRVFREIERFQKSTSSK